MRDADSDRFGTERIVRLVIAGLLAYWCFAIFRPFLMPFVWGVVLGVALYPVYAAIERATGGRRKLAATLMAVLSLTVVLVPAVALSESLVDGARFVSSTLDRGELRIPPAPERVAHWPIVGPTIHDTWNLASSNLDGLLERFRPQVKALGLWVVALAKQAVLAGLMTLVALVIAVVLQSRRDTVVKVALDIGARIDGEAGVEVVRLAGRTIGTVAKGVVGVAAIQAALAALGLVVAGIPGAGLWSLLILILAVAQLPPLLVLGPAILYLVATDASMVSIVLFAAWSLVVTVSDGLLKPLLLGRGSDTPVVVILIGAIGGLILHGLIGLFVGAVVFSTGHRLFRRWMEPPADLVLSVPPTP
ncbi:MAG TPA: AI-2E family transporter [Candidatus Polarisedimenticolaceae bacterium]